MTLAEAIETYVQRKRANGLLFRKGGIELFAFCKYLSNAPLQRVSASNVAKFLDQPSISARIWRIKYQLLKRFFEFWSERRAMPTMLMPPLRPLPVKIFTPYIYTRGRSVHSWPPLNNAKGEIFACSILPHCDPLSSRCMRPERYSAKPLIFVLKIFTSNIDA